MIAPSSSPPSSRSALGTMACLGAAVLLFEILLTRVLAVALFSHLAFAVIALALLGLAAGGWIAARHEGLSAEQRGRRAALALLIAAAAAMAAVLFLAWVPLVPEVIEHGGKEMVSYTTRRRAVQADPFQLHWVAIAAAGLLQMLPFAAASYAQSLMFAASPQTSGKLYAVDVAAACVGALAAVVLLPVLAGTNVIGVVTVLFVAAAALCPAAMGAAPLRGVRRAGAAILLLGGLAVIALRPVVLLHGAGFSESQVVDTVWTSLARVSLHTGIITDPEDQGDQVSLDNAMLLVDNTSRTRVAFLGDRESQPNLDRIPTSLRPDGDVLIIGAGGGEEIAGALATAGPAGRRVDAVEVADGMPAILRRHFGDRPDFLLDQPGVHYHIADGRAFIEHSEQHWSVIQLKEVNFHSIAGQVSSTWSPSLLFTVGAFAAYLDHLTPDGILSIERFYAKSHEVDSERLLSTLRVAADARGLELRDRVVIMTRPYRYGLRAAIMVSAAPFSDKDLDFIEAHARAFAHTIVHSPRHPVENATVRAMIDGDAAAACERSARETGVLLDPTTDDRPFSNQRLGLFQALFGHGGAGGSEGAIQRSSFRLMAGIVLGVSVVVALMFLIAGRRTRREQRRRGLAHLAIFAGLGVGFMLYEIVLVEKASLILGHPTIGLVTVLTALLLALAIGSALSSSLRPERRPRLRIGLAIATVALVFTLPAVLPAVGDGIYGLGLPARAAILFALLGLGSMPLGFLLPSALRAVAIAGTAPVSTCWALNGAASVLGTVGAALMVRSAGFHATALAATLIYAATALLWVLAAGSPDEVEGRAPRV